MTVSSNLSPKDTSSRFKLQTLLETSRMLAESKDMDFVLNNLLLITMGKLMVSRAMILIYQPGNNNYKVSKSKGGNCLPEGEDYSFQNTESLKEQSVIHCKGDEIDLRDLIGSKNCTLLNLRTSNNHIGFLCLGPKGDNSSLQEEEVEFIESLAIISSVAIANSRMFTELRRTNRMLDRKLYDLNTLFDLSKDFNMMVDRQEIVQTFKFAMLGQMLIRKFFFLLDHEDSREMVASSGINEALSQKQIDRLFEQGQDLVEVDNELRSNIPFLKNNDITALIGLHFQDEKVAVVGVGARANDEAYTPSDYNFLRSLGNLAVLSIEKSLLLEERIEKERLEEELNIAKNIQQGLLPDPIPESEQLDIAAQNISSHQVGGDYFDILETPNGCLLFAIGDVTGKGTPAALLMANLQAMLHVLLPTDLSLKDASGQINDIIYQNTPSDKFITFFWSMYNPQDSTLKFVNAGHCAPLWLKKDHGNIQKLEEGGLILGAMPTSTAYNEQTITVEDGDILVFYTDGVTEAPNPNQTEEFGEQRLINCIKENRKKNADEIQQSIVNKVLDFSNDIQHDDITLIVIKVC